MNTYTREREKEREMFEQAKTKGDRSLASSLFERHLECFNVSASYFVLAL